MKYSSVAVSLLVFVIYYNVICTSCTDWHFTGPNIALHKTAIQIPGSYQDKGPNGKSYPASLAVDGNNNTDFLQGSCSHTSALSYDNARYDFAEWTVDLGAYYNITGIIIYNRQVSDVDLHYRLKGFQVFGYRYMACVGGWCKIFDDNQTNKYNQDIINISLDSVQSFTKVAIKLPKRQSRDDDNIYLTLCEVEIYAEVCEQINVTHGTTTPDKPLFNVNEEAEIHCEKGFETNNPKIICLKRSNSFAWDKHPQCNIVTCALPNKPTNGYYKTYGTTMGNNLPLSLPFGTIINVVCDKGYESINQSSFITCQSDKKWSDYPPTCTKIKCPYPRTIHNGKYKFANKTIYSGGPSYYNTTIQVTCNKGYSLNGDDKRICNEQNMWTGNSSCQINECESPKKPENAMYIETEINGLISHYTNGSLHYLDQIRVICRHGYVNNASAPVIQCLETKLWSGKIGHCNLVTCKGLEGLNGGFYNYSKEEFANGYPYSTVVTAACKEPFQLSNPNNRSRKCNANGKWDSEPVTCIQFEEAASQSTNAPLIGGVTAAVVVILSVIVVVAFFLYRRSGRKDNNGNPKPYTHLWKRDTNERQISNSQDDVYSEIQDTNINTISENTYSKDVSPSDVTYSYVKKTTTNKNVMKHSNQSLDSLQTEPYYSFTNVNNVPKTAILVKDLSDLILTGSDAKRKFEKEFNELPQGMIQPHKEALKKKNIIKNRYRNLYAYDDTRVVLKTDEASQSDYINACYVHGFTTFKQYIASQGPTKEILVDFWRMIWQEESSRIVMLTNLIEEGKEKCEQYWPEEGTSHVFGNIIVHTEKIDNFSQFVKRTFQVKKEGSKQKSRTVTQYHFTAWPDKGVPKYASSLVQFTNKVKYDSVEQNGPIVVHCSAGVGRTGTFIALDFLTEQGKAMGYIDVLGTITAFRSQRVCLVQTLDQYIFVHHALVESLMLPTSALPAYKFPEAFQELLQIDTKKKKSKLILEFETLKKVSPVADEGDYVSSKLVRNRRKNRYSNVLPVEEFTPSLLSTHLDSDNRYINAVFLPSYKERKAFIITQTPLETTKEDFWDLIWEHDVHTIVMMNNIKETVDSEKYWPEKGESVTFGNIEITEDGVEKKNHHHLVTLSAKKHKLTRKIKQIRCGGWSYNHSLPDSPGVILTLLEIVKVWQRQSGHHTIVVHCMNGVDKSGLYCVISAVIDRLQIEQDVAISQVIEEMRSAREQVIPSVEQYKFCHETVLEFIHQFDTYSNFTE
ncbi:receptor-type tyrosine-protein phosphatase kappa-like [Ruditapes philippinarum]|uniref:receptor-type tyrosine-protein phosphatase kappa-like n=1 Tax=Ruditapes philippinarum TaxID=129788 RepID=UPI00295AC765|nr:receptor-type tyrosine-protein phosphatase kappa-like [Ruditapes philippinarum]